MAPRPVIFSFGDSAERWHHPVRLGHAATRYDGCPTVFFSAIAVATIVIIWL